jgi:hypothetical protein
MVGVDFEMAEEELGRSGETSRQRPGHERGRRRFTRQWLRWRHGSLEGIEEQCLPEVEEKIMRKERR